MNVLPINFNVRELSILIEGIQEIDLDRLPLQEQMEVIDLLRKLENRAMVLSDN